jgi:hypothetical protein
MLNPKLGLMHVHCTGEGIQSWKVLLDIQESYLTISIVESISEIKLADIDIEGDITVIRDVNSPTPRLARHLAN